MTASDEVFRVPEAIAGGDPTPGPSKGGRPPHAASDENRRQVKVMAARLMPQEAIAAVIGISDGTLRKYYGEELRQGDAEGCLRISGRSTSCWRPAAIRRPPRTLSCGRLGRPRWETVVPDVGHGGSGRPTAG